MIDFILDPICSVFSCVLTAAVVTLPVALLAITVDLLVGRWMAPRFRCWLWIVVAVRLLMPLAPASTTSIQNIWYLFSPLNATISKQSLENEPLGVSPRQDLWPDPSAMPDPKSVERIDARISQVAWEMVFTITLVTVWLFGTVVTLIRVVVASVRFQRYLRTIPVIVDPIVIDAVRSACREMRVTTPVVKRVPGLGSPALFGLHRPTLCLPEGVELSDLQLRMITIHEAMHIRRRDGWLAWFLTTIAAAHWYNPVAWLTVRRVERYREQACDDAVRQHTDQEEHGEYAKLLLHFAAIRPMTMRLGLLGLWFSRSSHPLTLRIANLTKDDCARSPWFVSTLAVALVALTGLTDAVGENNRNEPLPTFGTEATLSEVNARYFVEERTEANPIEARTYDLTVALERADSIPKHWDRQKLLLDYAMVGSLNPPLVHKNLENENQITLTMPRKQHELFANAIKEVEHFGHTFQVTVEVRVLTSDSIERVPGIDWCEAVTFFSPQTDDAANWTLEPLVEAEPPPLSVETVTFEFAPFIVFSLEEDDMKKVIEHSKGRPQLTNASPPKVTLFSGQTGTILDQSQQPFVNSVNYIRGDIAIAAQPNVVVIDEGAAINLSPKMHDQDHVDLRFRLTTSVIDGVRNVRLPGQEVTVQVPKVTRNTVAATRRMKQGESLLIAPGLGEQDPYLYFAITPRWFPDPVAD